MASQPYTGVLYLIAFLLYATVACLHAARLKFFWFDEICTVVVVRQGTPAGIWAALGNAVDSHPPLFYLIVSIFHRLVSHDELAYRLPSLIGFLCVPAALFSFMRRRADIVASLVAATIPFLSVLFSTYSIEARGYALMTGCLALAMVMWQQAALPWRNTAFAILLMAAASLHYYAVFSLVPFGIAESARFLRTRNFQVRTWLAITSGCVPVIAFWPVLSRYKQMYGGRFYQMAKLTGIPRGYADMFNASNWWAAGAVLVCLILLLVILIPPALRSKQNKTDGPVLFEERWLVLGFIGLPAVGYVFARLTGGAMKYDRYAVPAVLGISLGAAVVTSRLGKQSARWLLGVLLAIVAIQQARAWPTDGPMTTSSVQLAPTLWVEDMVIRKGLADLPVVVANGISYLPMTYYGSFHKIPLIYLVDSRAALDFSKSDSVDLGLSVLKPYLPLDVRDLAPFLRQHRSFLLYCDGDPRWNWLPSWLANNHYSMRPLAAEPGRTLYLVERA